MDSVVEVCSESRMAFSRLLLVAWWAGRTSSVERLRRESAGAETGLWTRGGTDVGVSDG